jgi:hypothetical protein
LGKTFPSRRPEAVAAFVKKWKEFLALALCAKASLRLWVQNTLIPPFPADYEPRKV